MPHLKLPAGSHYASMWGIPDQYAGMTASMLQRSRAFVKYAGVDVTILTYEHRHDYGEIRDRLRGSGAMVDGMRLANMWEDLRTWDDDRLTGAVPTFQGPVHEHWEPLGKRGTALGPLIRELRPEGGRHIQIDYFRADGTMLASDQRLGPDFSNRSVVLCDTNGEPLGSWRWVSQLYWLWLDSLPRDPMAWIIADSKTSAKPLIQYDRPDVAKLHVVRGSHLRRVDGRTTDKLVRSRRTVMENLDAWDAVVFLTKTQRDDVASMLGARDNLHVIPNSRNVPGELTNVNRPSGRGVMLSSLVERKRIQHAIRAMADARGRRLWWKGRLEVWGRGPLKRKLTLLIRKRNAPSSCGATPRRQPTSSRRRPSRYSPAAPRRSPTCSSRAWGAAASPSATTSRTVHPTSSRTGSTDSSCRTATSHPWRSRSGALSPCRPPSLHPSARPATVGPWSSATSTSWSSGPTC